MKILSATAHVITPHAKGSAPAPAHAPSTAPLPGDRCTPSSAAAIGRAEHDADLTMRGWAVNTGGSGPPPDLRTYAQQSSESNHAAARVATVAGTAAPFLGTAVGKIAIAALGALGGLAWDASQTQADAQAACPP